MDTSRACVKKKKIGVHAQTLINIQSAKVNIIGEGGIYDQ